MPLEPALLIRVEEPRARTEGGALVVTATNFDRYGNVQLGAGSEDISGLGVKLGEAPARAAALGRVAYGDICGHVQRGGRG